MLMVLMAILDAGRTRVAKATRWVWLLLSGGLVVTAPLSCEQNPQTLGTDNGPGDSGMEAQPLYGVPVDVLPDTCCQADVADVPSFDQPLYGVIVDVPADSTSDLGTQPLYGVVMDVPPADAPPSDLPQVLYGPVQVDADQDRPGDPGPQPLYGVIMDVTPVDDTAPQDTMVQPLYGVVMDVTPVEETSQDDAVKDTGIQPLYGPQPAYGVPVPSEP